RRRGGTGLQLLPSHRAPSHRSDSKFSLAHRDRSAHRAPRRVRVEYRGVYQHRHARTRRKRVAAGRNEVAVHTKRTAISCDPTPRRSTKSMNDEAAFLAAIAAAPDDNTTRLVYADWLDEHGRPEGAFLRTECELATLPTGRAQWHEVFAKYQRAGDKLPA